MGGSDYLVRAIVAATHPSNGVEQIVHPGTTRTMPAVQGTDAVGPVTHHVPERESPCVVVSANHAAHVAPTAAWGPPRGEQFAEEHEKNIENELFAWLAHVVDERVRAGETIDQHARHRCVGHLTLLTGLNPRHLKQGIMHRQDRLTIDRR